MKLNPINSLTSNYWRVILRDFLRRKIFSIGNLIGLGIAIACVLGIFAFVLNERSFDKHFSNHDRIYRVTYRFQNDTGYDIHWARVNQPWINELPDVFPQISQLVRFQSFRPRDVKIGERKFREEHAFAVDSSVFDVFDFKWEAGNPDALNTPYSVVLTSSTAIKYFSSSPAMNQTLELRNEVTGELETHVVRGIIDDPAPQSHLPITLLSSINSEKEKQGWAYTYLMLNSGQDITDIENGIADFLVSKEGDNAEGLSLIFQPLTDIHLKSALSREIVSNGDISRIRLFMIIGVFVLTIAAINFTNLQAVKSLATGKAIGIRKALGSGKNQISTYFLMESLMMTSMAAVIGALIFYSFLPVLSEFIGYELRSFWGTFSLLLAAIVAVITIISSFYPSIIYRSISPLNALMGKAAGELKGRNMQRILVSIQFLITVIMISGTLIIQGQFSFMVNHDMGFDQEQLIAFRNIPEQARDKYETFKEHLLTVPGVENVTALMEIPSSAIKDEGVVRVQGMEETFTSDIQVMDINGLQVMGMKLVAGEGFPVWLKNQEDAEEGKDLLDYLQNRKREYLINESASEAFGWANPEEAIGSQIDWSIGNVGLARGPIIGVVKDYHQEGLQQKVDPQVLVYEPIWLNNIIVRTSSGSKSAVSTLEKAWDTQFPDLPVKLTFLEEDLQRLYVQEKRMQQLMSVFTGIGILITIMGLFGLITYVVEKQLKELAIRRILGADWQSFINLLGKEYLWMAIFSLAIGIPIVWRWADNWLSSYAFHIELSAIHFMSAVLFLVLLIVVVLLIQIVRLSQRNPVDVIRTE